MSGVGFIVVDSNDNKKQEILSLEAKSFNELVSLMTETTLVSEILPASLVVFPAPSHKIPEASLADNTVSFALIFRQAVADLYFHDAESDDTE